ncbi:MAG TPA: photosystem reaction center subunit H [Peptococcaceae bacterium]|nr:photosystem reaction center subunit H [Peptococcaceae bacterium]
MLPSKKFLSLPIISLKEGQQIGFVRNLVINPKTRSVAALIVDPKGFFKEQRIIPFNRVVSIGENAITVSTESQVEKAINLPDILDLLKEKTAIIGIKIITTNGKTLGIVDEFYVNPEDGSIVCLDFSGGKIEGLFNGKLRIKANEILTMGSDVIVVAKDCEERIEILSKGLNENVKSILQTASGKAAEKKHKLSNSWRNRKSNKLKENKEEPSSEQYKPEEDKEAAASGTVEKPSEEGQSEVQA